MRVVVNSDDFFRNLQGILNRYDNLFPQLAELRLRYTDQERDAQQPELEFHRRCYIINDLLALLNWRLDQTPETGLPNLVPEQVPPDFQGVFANQKAIRSTRETAPALL